MKIGEALKKVRQENGKTQAEFSQNIFSAANYSKIERGKQEIDAADLLKLLNNNKVDWRDFFEAVVDEYVTHYSNMENSQSIITQLTEAYYAHDLKKVEKLDEVIEKNNFSTELKLRSFLVKHLLIGDLKQVNAATKHKYGKELFETNDWTQDRYKLRLFSNSMLMFENEDLIYYISKFLKDKNFIINSDIYFQSIAGSICINYLMNCYDRHIKDKVTDIMLLIEELPAVPELFIYKCLGNYFKAIFSGNNDKAENIKNFLEQNGLREFSKSLPK